MNSANMLWQGLLANLATVAILTMLWTQVMQHASRRSLLVQNVLFGSLMGFGVLVVMQMPFQTGSGFRLDHRFTLIATAGFFGGPIALAITAGTASLYRLYIGGLGALPGLIGIGISAAIGLVAYYSWTRRGQQKYWHILAFSLAVPAGVLAGLFILPKEMWPTSLPDIAGPLGATIFLATVCCTLAIFQEQRRLAAVRRTAVYEAIINALPDCLNVKDVEGRFVAANPATARLMGAKSAHDLIGRTDFDFYDQTTAALFRAEETNFLSSGVAVTVEQTIIRPDGRTTWLSTLKAPLRDEDGLLTGVITHNRDVTEQRNLEKEIRAVRQTLDDAITNMNDGLVVLDRDGRILFCNEQYRGLFPLTADIRFPGALIADIMAESLRRGERVGDHKDNEKWLQAVSQDNFARFEEHLHLADGRWLQIKSVGVSTGALLLVSDISGPKKAEADIEAAAREYRALFENSVAGIFRSTIDGRMVRANPALARLNGFTTEKELVDSVNDIAREWYVDPARRAEFQRLMAEHGRVTDFVSQVYRFKTRELIWISETAWSVTGADGKLLYYEGTITEITDRKLAEEALEQANSRLYSLARTDGLTGLANRRAFDDCMAAEFERARGGSTPLSVLMIDVDYFKRFNDTYGHVKGDECLRFIGKVVSTIPRGYGDKACRYGGEELVVVLPDTDRATARRLAEQLCRAVYGLGIGHSGSDKGVVTVSVGVASMSTPGAFIRYDDLVAEADAALYQAKAGGRNLVIAAAA